MKLLPTWLPDALFEVLQARWNSRQRLTRCQVNFSLVFTTLNLKSSNLQCIRSIFPYCTLQAKYLTHDRVQLELHVACASSSQAHQLPKVIFLSLTLQIKHHSDTIKQNFTLRVALEVWIEDCGVTACICSQHTTAMHICKPGRQCPRQPPIQLVARQTYPGRNTLKWCLNLLMLCCDL